MGNVPANKNEMESTDHHIPLTASEIGFLWAQYLNDSLDICVMEYFKNICEDNEILPLIESSLKIAQNDILMISEIFSKENHPIPVGFTDKDVNPKAPRLYSDAFIAAYIQKLEVIAMSNIGLAIGFVARSDVSTFFQDLLYSVVELHDKARKVMLSKGIYMRSPQIPAPKKVDFVKKQSYLFDFLGNHKRPLTALEITHVFNGHQTNSIGKVMMMAFSQVSTDEEVKEFFKRGKEISNKHMTKFASILNNEDITAPSSWESHVTGSTIAPFSDKLMMFQTTYMNAVGIGNYGMAAGTCQRMDLSATFTRLAAEIALFAEDGANILIKNGWLEEAPQAVDHKTIVNQSKIKG